MAEASLAEQHGLQAQFDWWALKGMMRHMDPIIPHTFVPLLGLLSEDPAGTRRAYEDVKKQRRIIRWHDSPRTKWSKRYGNYVRELEWVSHGLQKLMSKQEYESFVAGTVAHQIEGWIGFIKPLMARALPQGGDDARPGGAAPSERGSKADAIAAKLVGGFLRTLNVGGFLVGPMELARFEANKGMIAYVPSCGMHTVVSDTEPQTEACLRSCKGACEEVFGGDSKLAIHFEPHLPSLDCTMKITWDGSPPEQFHDDSLVQLRKRNRNKHTPLSATA